MTASTETRSRLATLRANALARGDLDTVSAVDAVLEPRVCLHNDARACYSDEEHARFENAHRRPGEDFQC